MVVGLVRHLRLTNYMAPSISCLSSELTDMILANCDHATSVALSLTSRIMYSKIAPTTRQHYTMTDLLQIELWPCYDGASWAEGRLKQPMVNRDYFACHLCLRIRKATKFSNAMMKGKRGKHCQSGYEKQTSRLTRFCIECGIRSGRYLPGTTFDVGGVSFSSHDSIGGGHGLVCQRCKRFERTIWAPVGRSLLCSLCVLNSDSS